MKKFLYSLIKVIVHKHFRKYLIRKLYFGYIFKNKNVQIGAHFDPIQDIIFSGKGEIIFGNSVSIGFINGGGHYNNKSQFDSRLVNSKIIIKNNVKINNNIYISSCKSIIINENVLIGANVTIFDYEAHGTQLIERNNLGKIGEVVIGKNVWIGSNTIILKNVYIGEGTIVAAGSVVIKGNYPSNVIIGGNPAKVIKSIN